MRKFSRASSYVLTHKRGVKTRVETRFRQAGETSVARAREREAHSHRERAADHRAAPAPGQATPPPLGATEMHRRKRNTVGYGSGGTGSGYLTIAGQEWLLGAFDGR